MAEENPLIKALPPETDYLSYLTILEYNLNREQLPTLHNILQDTDLTANIGWDLVHLLLPLLPESKECLRDVSRLGNPREIILKVTESLEELAHEDEGEEIEEHDEAEAKDTTEPSNATENGKDKPLVEQAPQKPARPSKETRFSTLLSMLTIVHPRIKTRYPSRFLSTSLQSILTAYTSLGRSTIATESIISLAKRLSGTKRPELPPRKSSASIAVLQSRQESAPDPEANADGVGAGEEELQRQLLRSFLTYAVQVYIEALSRDDVSGMCYASRYLERIRPEKNIPNRKTFSEIFQEDDHQQKDSLMGQFLVRLLTRGNGVLTSKALSRDIGLNPPDLITTILKPPDPSAEETVDDLPSSANDVPLSTSGALFILSAWLASRPLFQTNFTPQIELPDYTELVNAVLPDPSSPEFGSQPPAFLDAVFFLGLYTLHTEPFISPTSDEAFNAAMQRLSLLSAQLPDPTLRYHAHYLAFTLLSLQSSDEVKLAYIKDTLEHCPFENLKGSAVGWLKDEIVTANAPNEEGSPSGSIFSSPALIDIVGEWLWGDRVGVPMYSAQQSDEETAEEFANLQKLLSFYLAVLNLIFLLLSNKTMSTNLDVGDIIKGIREDFLEPLSQAAKGFEEALSSGKLNDGEDEDVRRLQVAEMQILAMNCQQALGLIDAGLVAR